MRTDLYWIPGPWRGRLAITLRPRGGDWLSDEAEAWRSAGVDAVVSLLEREEQRQLGLAGEESSVARVGIEFLSFPIPDRGIPSSRSEAVGFLSQLAALLDAGKSVAVHCRQSIGRSGMIAAAVLMTAGDNPADAIKAVSTARGLAIPETAEQRAWVESLPSALPVAGR